MKSDGGSDGDVPRLVLSRFWLWQWGVLRISHLSIKGRIPVSQIVSKYENRWNIFVRGAGWVVASGQGEGLHNCPERGGVHRSKQFKDQMNRIIAPRTINTLNILSLRWKYSFVLKSRQSRTVSSILLFIDWSWVQSIEFYCSVPGDLTLLLNIYNSGSWDLLIFLISLTSCLLRSHQVF